MKAITILLITISFGVLNAQTAYEKAMQNTFNLWGKAETSEDLLKVTHMFDRISKKDSTKWQPLYYSILTRTFKSFELPKEEAFKSVEKIEEDYERLKEISNNDEVKTLRGLFLTVKVAKDPMTFGPTLSGEIVKTYAEALAENPNNPRAMYLKADYEMQGAKYWGKDIKEYCPQIKKSVELYKAEEIAENKDFSPTWGSERAESILKETCSETE